MRNPPRFIDQSQSQRLLAGPDLPGGQWLDLVAGGVAACGDVMDELAVHVIDQRLKIGLFLRRYVVSGIASVLQFSCMNHDGLQFGPLHEIAVVGPFHDDANGADHRGVVGIDAVTAASDVVAPEAPTDSIEAMIFLCFSWRTRTTS